MTKIMIVVGTRPEAIKLAPVIHALDATRGLVVRVCATGQHPQLAIEALAQFDISPDLVLGPHPDRLDALFASLLASMGRMFDAEQPDRVIVQGDTSSAVSGALAAYHRRIPVAHIEAGLRSGDLGHPWPEEGNRKIITALADMHFAPTARAAAALRAENVPASTIFTTGNTGIDALFTVRSKPASMPVDLRGRRLILVTCHRRESFGPGLAEIAAALRALAQRTDVIIALPLHPNPQVRHPLEAALSGLDNVHLFAALAYPAFVALLSAATLVLTDSGGVQEEAPALGVPVLVMRETTERPEGIETGTARLVGAHARRIVTEACRLLDDSAAHALMARAHNPYGDGRAAVRVAAVIAEAHGVIRAETQP